MTTQLWEISLIIIASFFVGFAPILLKRGISRVKGLHPKYFVTNWNLIFGMLTYGISYVISIPAFKSGDVSVLYPFVSLAYVWVSLFSIRFLKEKINVIKWAGISGIMIGVTFIGLGI